MTRREYVELAGKSQEKILPITCTPVFTAALFTIARAWKQPKCPSTEEWINVVHINTAEYLAIKKNEMSFAATWMDLEVIILNEVRQSKTNII